MFSTEKNVVYSTHARLLDMRAQVSEWQLEGEVDKPMHEQKAPHISSNTQSPMHIYIYGCMNGLYMCLSAFFLGPFLAINEKALKRVLLTLKSYLWERNLFLGKTV